MNPYEIAEEVEQEMSDALADLAMIVRLVSSSPDLTASLPPKAENAPLRICLAQRWLGGWPRAEWQSRLSGYDSQAIRRLTQQWIVTTFSRWEEVHRPRLFLAGDDGALDLFGDLRLLRNDIVHHDAISTAKNGARCKILNHFKAGALIYLSPEDFVQIMDELEEWVKRLGGTSHGRVVRDPEGRHRQS
ncbi:hypothetical protein GCM10023168_18200 [Fodinibacter luteus]|uniref:RiboL-PSP-HEPN domain-containing protein n=1 Tax=Fodinibacter luteus TaxID=552064 RepID=A0ABP8KEM3_9MICO